VGNALEVILDLVYKNVRSMELNILNSNVNSVAQDLNGSVGKQLTSVTHAMDVRLRVTMSLIRQRESCLNAKDLMIAP
jgi:hypothetical protein